MKSLITICLIFISSVVSAQIHIPDVNFKQALIDWGYDDNADGEISTSEAEDIRELYISNTSHNPDLPNVDEKISDLTGIEKLINLVELECSSNLIEILDLRYNTKLARLSCGNNKLTSIQFCQNSPLEELNLGYNLFYELDLYNCPHLRYLNCSGNEFAELDLNNLIELEYLNCSHNQLIIVDISQNTNLKNLVCSFNSLTDLDVSYNANLDKIDCSHNQITNLDLSQNNKLGILNFGWNPIVNLDFLNSITYLYSLNCGGLSLTDLSFAYHIDGLYELAYPDNNISSFNTSEFPLLESVDCSNNNLSNLEFLYPYSYQLTSLNYSKNQVTNEDYSHLPNLYKINCSENGLTFLDVSNNRYLQDLNCSYNQLTSLQLCPSSYVGNNLNISHNQLSEIVFHANTPSNLDCSFNQLVDLEISGPVTHINCSNNHFTELTISADFIESIDCSNNQLTSLNIPFLCYEYEYSWLVTVNASNNPQLSCIEVAEGCTPSAKIITDHPVDFSVDCGPPFTIPDENFKQALIDLGVDKNNDGQITKDEVLDVIELPINNADNNIDLPNVTEKISDLTGIEGFINLRYLYCSNNLVSNLDLSQNIHLEHIECGGNQMTEILPGSNSQLKRFYCDNNLLTTLDLGNCPSIYSLDCKNNELNILDLSHNTSLEFLNCSSNQLTSLDISNNANLSSLDCSHNQLTTLDLSQNTNLNSLNYGWNQIGPIDLTNNIRLEGITCAGNGLNNLDFIPNLNIGYLNYADNNVSSFDVSRFPQLFSVNCSNNQLTSLDFLVGTGVYELNCSNNNIPGSEIGKFSNMETLVCSGNNLSTLEFGQDLRLYNLDCSNNNLEVLDLSNNSEAMQKLNCSHNNLTEIIFGRVGDCNIDCSYNLLESQNFPYGVTRLNCSHNKLKALKSTMTFMVNLNCSYNDLIILDLPYLSGLDDSWKFDVSNNNLTCIRVSQGFVPGPNWIYDPGVIFSNDCDCYAGTYEWEKTVSPLDPITNTDPVTVTFSEVTSGGLTALLTSETGPEISTGFSLGEPPTYYDIVTTAGYSGSIEIVIDYSSIQYENELNLCLMHYENDQWVDVTDWIDVENNLIYGIVTSLSPFAVIEDLPPVIESIIAPADPVALGNNVNVTVIYNEEALTSAIIYWGDNTFEIIEEGFYGNTISWNHLYGSAGVYSVSIQLIDQAGSRTEETHDYIVIFDPDGGFVTGGGWIDSPAGASTLYPDAVGKANFGFVSKYRKGTTIPIGNTEFQFKAGDLDFNSYLYDWLVIAGSKAMFKGEGTINGTGTYGFMISAIDGDLKNIAESDKFRIKIWDKMDEDAVVYDNQAVDMDDADPTTVIGGGSIVIHSKDVKKSSPVVDPETRVKIYPIPFNNFICVDLFSSSARDVIIDLIDIQGRSIHLMYAGTIGVNVENHFELNANLNLSDGSYILRIRTVNGELLGREIILKH